MQCSFHVPGQHQQRQEGTEGAEEGWKTCSDDDAADSKTTASESFETTKKSGTEASSKARPSSKSSTDTKPHVKPTQELWDDKLLSTCQNEFGDIRQKYLTWVESHGSADVARELCAEIDRQLLKVWHAHLHRERRAIDRDDSQVDVAETLAKIEKQLEAMYKFLRRDARRRGG